MKKLTEHFNLDEMIRSSTAIRKGINNTPSDVIENNLKLLCEHVLEPVRAAFGKTVRITSGYRSPKLNKSIGGSTTSQHCEGKAADFTVDGISNKVVCEWIRDNLVFDQLIYEFGEAGWVHCSYDNTPRQNVISAKKKSGKTIYVDGIK